MAACLLEVVGFSHPGFPLLKVKHFDLPAKAEKPLPV